MSHVVDFACKVAEQVTDTPYDLVRAAYNDNENLAVLNAADYQPYGIDPMTILAIITAIIQVMDLLKNGCNKTSQFAENARLRNPLMLAIFRSRVWLAAKQAGYTRNPRQLADALLDVAHSTGATKVAEVVEELDMI
jgi:hypothetical protein